MNKDFTFSVKSIRFDEDYIPTDNTRATTNFANLARGSSRQNNLRNACKMIDSRFNSLAKWDNPNGDRYSVELDIISASINIGDEEYKKEFPLIEILKTCVFDKKDNKRISGVGGNNFSSYIRDYDFSILLPEHNKTQEGFSIPDNFGDLHGSLFKRFLASSAYREHFKKPPVICLSVSSSKIYRRTENHHPILGAEYRQDEFSSTDRYFEKMGLQVRYFMPADAVAPLAFYFKGDLLNDYTNLELISTISTMETFQKIYRPEIYNANSAAGMIYRPSLTHGDYSLTRIVYDRDERSKLAVEQGKYVEKHLMKPYQSMLEKWTAELSL